MFIWTAKVNRRKLSVALLGALVVCGAVAAALLLPWQEAAASASISPKGVKTAEDRVAYLSAWGWEVPAEATSVEELTIPEEMGPEYDDYLALLAEQGFDLTKYAGKRIKRYTYPILNYPGGRTDVVAHLIIYKNTVIGGEILGDNLLHGLAMPET